MSAWMEIVNAKDDDDWLQTCELAMREIQRVALHRAAEKIREAANEVNYGHAAAEARHAFANEFADLIDPNA